MKFIDIVEQNLLKDLPDYWRQQYPVTLKEAFKTLLNKIDEAKCLNPDLFKVDWENTNRKIHNYEHASKRQSPESGFKSLAQAWLPRNT